MPSTFLDSDVEIGNLGVKHLSQQGFVVVIDAVTLAEQEVVLGKEELKRLRMPRISNFSLL